MKSKLRKAAANDFFPQTPTHMEWYCIYVVNHTQNLSPENFGINAMNVLSGHMLSAQE